MIRRAEGERDAAVQVAKGKAEAIRLVNEAAEQYFQGNAQLLRQYEMTEVSLRDNTKVVITEHGINPTLLLGQLPIAGPDSEAPPSEKRTSKRPLTDWRAGRSSSGGASEDASSE
jgi:hypothetical protein